MTSLEIRVAALQFLNLRLAASVPLSELEAVRSSVEHGVRAGDLESDQMLREIVNVLDQAIARARQKLSATTPGVMAN